MFPTNSVQENIKAILSCILLVVNETRTDDSMSPEELIATKKYALSMGTLLFHSLPSEISTTHPFFIV